MCSSPAQLTPEEAAILKASDAAAGEFTAASEGVGDAVMGKAAALAAAASASSAAGTG